MGLPGAMENFSTSVSVAVKSLNDNLGITKLLASALGVMSENAGAVVGGIIGLTVAAVGLLAVMVPLATATAIATGGLTLLAAAGVGAAIGLAAQEAGVFADKTKDATKSQQQLNEEAKKGVKYTTQRVQQAIELDKSIQQTIAQLKAQNVIEAQGTGIRSLALEVEREVAKEREKYKKTGQAILPELERELAAETRKKILLEETNSTKRKFLELQSSTLVAGVQDAGQRQIINGLESFRLSVTVETYNQYKAQYQALLQTNLQAQALVEFSTRLRESQSQITVLSIKDLDVREQQSAVDRERLRLGILFTSEMESQVRASVQNAQAARDMLSVEQARRALSGTQTFGENVQRGVGVQQRMNPQGNLDTQYKMDMDALKVHLDNKLIAEDEYQNQLLRLKSEYANRSNELFIQQIQIERDQRQTSMQAEQQRLGKTQEQAKTYADFMMKTEEQKTQFALESAGQMFSALGAQNKKAFEAAKAFNIANAIMNTYMAATKAMASYPFPFSLIAAGAAVAMGLAQVAQIRAQTYSGRALGGPVMGGTPYLVGESGPELFTPNTTGSITRNQDLGGGGAVNVSFNIMANDTAGFDDLLLSRRGLIRSVISDAMLESGRRG